MRFHGCLERLQTAAPLVGFSEHNLIVDGPQRLRQVPILVCVHRHNLVEAVDDRALCGVHTAGRHDGCHDGGACGIRGSHGSLELDELDAKALCLCKGMV